MDLVQTTRGNYYHIYSFILNMIFLLRGALTTQIQRSRRLCILKKLIL